MGLVQHLIQRRANATVADKLGSKFCLVPRLLLQFEFELTPEPFGFLVCVLFPPFVSPRYPTPLLCVV